MALPLEGSGREVFSWGRGPVRKGWWSLEGFARCFPGDSAVESGIRLRTLGDKHVDSSLSCGPCQSPFIEPKGRNILFIYLYIYIYICE